MEKRKEKLEKEINKSQNLKLNYIANENEMYQSNLASSLRNTAQELTKQRRRDSLTRNLLNRSNKSDLQESGILLFDDKISPVIQSNAMNLANQLDFLQKKGMITSLLDAKKEIESKYDMNSINFNKGRGRESQMLSNKLNNRPNSIELIKQGILHASPEIAGIIHNTINELEQQLGERLTTEQLRDLGIMGSNPEMARSLQPTAAKLASLLAKQMKQEVELQNNIARSLQQPAINLEKNIQKDQLKSKLNARKDKQEMIDSGILPTGNLPSSIAPNAFNLEKSIKERVTSEYLERKGIMKDPKKHIKIGDHIQLYNGLTGKVKWIGKSDVSNEELIGIKLDYWNSMAGNGSIGVRRYFIVDDGFGLYVHRENLSNYVTSPKPLVSQNEINLLKKNQREFEENKLNERKKRVKKLRKLLSNINQLELKAKNYGTFTILTNDEKRLIAQKRILQDELDELSKRRLSLTLENALLSRPTPQEMIETGVLKSFDISPALQSAAYLLESKLRRRQSMNQIAMKKIFGQSGTYKNISEMNISISNAINYLENKLSRRPSIISLQKLNILRAAKNVISPKLEKRRNELENKLNRRPSIDLLKNTNILNGNNNVDMNIRQEKLENQLRGRRNSIELMENNENLFPLSQIDPSLRNKAYNLDNKLENRPTINELTQTNILPFGNSLLAANQKKLYRRRLSLTLKEKLEGRAPRSTLQEIGILLPYEQTNFSRQLSNAANEVNKKLKRRPSLDQISTNIYRSNESQIKKNNEYLLLQNQLNFQLNQRPTLSTMLKNDRIQHTSLSDFDITIPIRPAGIRFKEGTNFVGLYVDEVRPNSVPNKLGVNTNDLLVTINSYNVENIPSNKVINMFRTTKLPMHCRFRRNGALSHQQQQHLQGKHLRGLSSYNNIGGEFDDDEDDDISPLGSPRKNKKLGIDENTINNIINKITNINNEKFDKLNRQIDLLINNKQNTDKQFKKINRTIDLMKTEINSLRIEKVRWKQENERLQKANSDLVDRILVLDHELEQIKAEMSRLNGEYTLNINKRPVGITWSHTNNKTQLKVGNIIDSSIAELFNVESGDVLVNINNHDVENIDSERVQTWFEKCPLPMNVSFRRKETNLELERAKYSLEKQRKEIWDRLNARDNESDDESDDSEDYDSDDDDDDDDEDYDDDDNKSKLKLLTKSGSNDNLGVSNQGIMTQVSLTKLPTTPRALSNGQTYGSNNEISILKDVSNFQNQVQQAEIDALELEMKLELERLQKYNETGDDSILNGSMTPSMSNPNSYLGPNQSSQAHHHRLATLEQMWDGQKPSMNGNGNNLQTQFTPQQLIQLQKLLDQQQQQTSVNGATIKQNQNGVTNNNGLQSQSQTQTQSQEEPKPKKKKKKKMKKSKGIGAIASRFE